MEHFAQLKRRTTDLLQSLPESLSALPETITSPTKTGFGHVFGTTPAAVPTMKGTWQRVELPPLPRSSHSLDVVAGTAYVFGGEGATAREPVDNAMHVLVLPTGSAAADYYAVPAVAAKTPTEPETPPPAPTVTISEPPESDTLAIDEPTTVTAADDQATTPAEAAETEAPDTAGKDKGKDKADGDENLEDVEEIPLPEAPLPDVPPPRVGHATAVIGRRIFMFGGRGGPDMAPLPERGRVWVFDTKTNTWTFLDPQVPATPPAPLDPATAEAPVPKRPAHPVFPEARSYHVAAASELPAAATGGAGGRWGVKRATSWKEWAEGDMAEVGTPQRPIVGNIAARARDADGDGYGTLLVHGGCLAGGGRAADLWAFDVRTRVWQRLPDAPGLPRGGAALCVGRGQNRLYRFGGFNGADEEGGRLDVLDLGLSAAPGDDVNTSVEDEAPVTLVARSPWHSIVPDSSSRAAATETPAKPSPKKEDVDDSAAAAVDANADDETDADTPAAPLTGSDTPAAWPGNRSVASLEAITVGGGWEYLVLALGERSPSGSGHAAAGTFWGDVWALQVPSDHLSAASVSNAVRSVLPGRLFGRSHGTAGEGRWARVVTAPYDPDDADADNADFGPGPRGWVASAPMRELEENGIVVFGGLNEKNQRLGDAWIFRLGAETREL